MRAIRRFALALTASITVAMLALAPATQAIAGSVRADMAAKVSGRYTAASGLGSASFELDQTALVQFAPGTGIGKADLAFADRRTLAASATENLDLAGALVDPLGAALTFGHVKAIYITARSTNTNAVVVGGAASNGFAGPFGGTAPTLTIPPGGFLMLAHPGAGWTVTPATGDLLKIANAAAGTSVQYDVVIIGTSN
jgi:hypothetical protein